MVRAPYKATQSLQKQAKFIESLAWNNKNKASNIWNNVIVVYRGTNREFEKSVIKDA
jgi:hypothetical protein